MARSKKSPCSPSASPKPKKAGKRCRKGSKRVEYLSPKGKKVRNCVPVHTAWNEILKLKRAEMGKKALLKDIMTAAKGPYTWYKANVPSVDNKVPIVECKIAEAMKH